MLMHTHFQSHYHKFYTLLCALVCLVLLLTGLPSCSGDGEITGTWKITECIVGGEALTDMNDCYFYFYNDETGKKVILDEEQFTFSYSYDGVTCVLFNITYDDGEVEAGTYAEMQVRGDKMYISATENGVEELVTLERVKE